MTSRLNAAAPLVLRDFDLDFLSGRRLHAAHVASRTPRRS